jgi:peptidoglycan/LPS O-acetylase OafA/YrhL
MASKSRTLLHVHRYSAIFFLMPPLSRDFAPIDFRTRFPALDGIRALAVTLVFLLHYGGGSHGGWLLRGFNAVRERGWVGVDLFFVLSGFLITGILYDTATDPRFFKLFYIRRSLRIFPAFYLVAVVLLLLTPVFGYQWHRGHLPFLAYLGNITGSIHPSLYAVVSTRSHSDRVMLTHLWSLCVEEQFYLLWPLVVWWVRDRIRLIQIAGGLAIVAFALRLLLALQPQSASLQEWINHALPTRMDTLLAGAILALLLRGPRANLWQRSCKWLFLAGFACSVATMLASPAWLETAGYVCIAAAGAGLIGCTLRPESIAFRFFYLRSLRILGKYSYGFYLFSLLWQYAWVHVAESAGAKLHSTILGTALVMTSNALVTFVVAKLSYDLLEVRFLRLKRHFEYAAEIIEGRHAFTTR